MAKRKFWQKPSLHFDEEENKQRKVTWLELFFDLYFVVVIAAVAHNLTANLTWRGFIEFAITFIPVWWIWIGVTYYNDRFETDGFENRLFIFLLLIPIAGLAVFSHDAIGHNLIGFVLSYAIARLITLLMWIYATYHNHIFRKSGIKYIFGFSISIILCITAVIFSGTMGLVIFGLAMLIDLVTPLFAVKSNKSLPKFSTSKLPERFGLFIIIVLGEGVVGTINGISTMEHINSNLIWFGTLGIAITFSLWWIYFDFIGRRIADHSNSLKQFGWAYMHMPLVICFVAVGASITGLIDDGNLLNENAKVLLITASGFAILVLAILETLLMKTDDEPMHYRTSPWLKTVTGIGVLLLYFIQERMSPKMIMMAILLILSINMIYGMYAWFGQNLDDVNGTHSENEIDR